MDANFIKEASSTTPNDIQVNFVPSRDEDKQLKEINIPTVEELFRYQTRDKLIYENRKLYKMLGSRHLEIDDAVKKLKAAGSGDKTDPNIYMAINSKEKDLDKII